MKKFLTLMFILVAFAIPANAQSFPDFDGDQYLGFEFISMSLIAYNGPWSTPPLGMMWHSTIAGDHEMVTLCRDTLFTDGNPQYYGYCRDYYWNDSANAYVNFGPSVQGVAEVSVVIFYSNHLLVFDDRIYTGDDWEDPPLWAWFAQTFHGGPKGLIRGMELQ